MKNGTKFNRWLMQSSALAMVATFGASVTPALAQDNQQAAGTIEEVVVTAQRRSESIQDVPVAVTAFNADMIDKMQLENFGDLALFTPNVSFSKTNFTSTNFQIRGVGNALVAASADSGVGVLVNDVPLNTPRLFETEYFDVSAIEILRGPQGTLFGRNATSGTINMKTNRPVLEESQVALEAEYGNYNAVRATGAVNLPLGDNLAVRFAGIYVNRDGYTENVVTGNDIDGRNSYALRGSLLFEPSENTTLNVMVSYFDEDSDRTRSTKTMCHTDPTGVLGCLPDTLEFSTTNGFSQLGVLLTSDAVLGPLALFPFANGDPNAGAINPQDMRKIALDFDPIYKSDEFLITAQLDQKLGEDYTGTIVFGYQDTSVFSQTDYTGDLTPAITLPALLPFAAPTAYNTYYSGGTIPISTIDDGTFTGIIGGNYVDTLGGAATAYDQSDGAGKQWSVEARINSDLDGPLNFQFGGLLLDYKSDFSYFVVAATLDYFSVVYPELIGLPGFGFGSPYYHNDTKDYDLKSWAMFGEVYYDIASNLKLTGGLRYTNDEKTISDRQTLYNVFMPFGTADGNPFFENPLFGETPTTYRDDKVTFKEVTGRVVLNWTPDLAGTDDTLIYASYSRGYKGGGFNPAFDPVLFPNTAPTFKPEFIDAFEIGMKNTLADGRLQANLTAFYYDYQNLQVSKIINRTSFNENIPAKIWGLEAEFIAAPNENLLFNLNAAYLNTEIGNYSTIDTRDPTQGDPDYLLIKDVLNASNCAIKFNGLPNPTTFVPGLVALPTPGQANGGAFATCDGLLALEGLGYDIVDGKPVNLQGNELRQSPNFTMNLGAQYNFLVGGNMNLTVRADYYIQSSMYSRIFNRPIDKIKSWDVLNMKATLASEAGWSLSAFVQNLMNDDNITGHYVTDYSSGLFTNVFVQEPRRFGVIAGYKF